MKTNRKSTNLTYVAYISLVFNYKTSSNYLYHDQANYFSFITDS